MGTFDSMQTPRLLMRRWRESDRAPFAELNADPQTLVYFPRTLARAESDALVDRAQASFDQRGYDLWAGDQADGAVHRLHRPVPDAGRRAFP